MHALGLNCVVVTKMACSLALLPFFLPPEQFLATLTVKGKKRSYWKPSTADSMLYFIDIQKVCGVNFAGVIFCLSCVIVLNKGQWLYAQCSYLQ